MLEISSKENKLFKELLSLNTAKGLRKSQQFLLSGETLTNEFLQKFPDQVVSEIFCADQIPVMPPKFRIKLSKELFAQLDVLGTHSRIFAAKQKKIEAVNFSTLKEGLHVLLPLGDPSNLGAAIRSAAGFAVSSVILLKESANIYLPKSLKAAAGATFHLNIFEGPSIKELVNLSFRDLNASQLIALDSQGEDIVGFRWPKKSFLLVGEEGAGVPNISSLKKIRIPTQNIESLNATNALSIALYDYKVLKSSL